ncbi:MAG TPA: heme-binding domain-containing protein [Chitinophagaceae bacterium]|nr:heme-binding domain-containing protein [Chitinophagaceae bacterium]
MFRKIMLVLLVALIVIQFIHPKKNRSEGPQPNFIGNVYPIPADAKAVLAKACFDCHSNNTRYPWYTNIQPVHWWLDKHIVKGKKAINFDEYTHKPLRYQYHKLEETVEMIKDEKMPIKSYKWTHKDARLNETDKNALITWANGTMDSMKARYPIDSLIRKK